MRMYLPICCAVLCSVTQSCPTIGDTMNCSPLGSSVHGDSTGKNTGAGYHALPQGIFPTQESNRGLPHCRRILYHLSHQGSPRILEWEAYLFSRGSSQPRNWTRISCIAGKSFTSSATREATTYQHMCWYFSECVCLSFWIISFFCCNLHSFHCNDFYMRASVYI